MVVSITPTFALFLVSLVHYFLEIDIYYLIFGVIETGKFNF